LLELLARTVNAWLAGTSNVSIAILVIRILGSLLGDDTQSKEARIRSPTGPIKGSGYPSLMWGVGMRVTVGGCFKSRLIGRVRKLRFRAAVGATSAR
jgi:hypothetical protein